MTLTVRHSLSMTTPDDPAYENRPSHWNQLHVLSGAYVEALSAGTRSDSGSIVFANSNGVSFGLNAGTMTASAAAAADGFNRLAAGTQTAGTLQTIVFADSHGLSFGMSGSSQITASYTVPTQSAQTQNVVVPSAGTQTASSGTVVFANSNGISFGMSGSSQITASYTVPTQSAQPGLQSLSAGTTRVTTGEVVFSNSNGVSFGVNGATVTASHNALTAQTVQPGIQSLSAGTTRVTTGEVVFSNSNGISFGVNGGTLTASYTVPAAQSNQALGLYAVSNTTGQSSSSTFDARTLSFHGAGIISIGYSGGSVVVSASAAGAADGVNVIAAGTRTATTNGTVLFSNSNGISFGLNAVNGSVVTASYTVPTQTVQTQNVAVPSAGTQTATSGTVVFANSNGMSFGMSGSSQITASYTVPSVPAQTAQTLGLYAVSNTTGQSSSSTFDARTLSFHGAGIASVGYSAGSVLISVPSGGGVGDGGNTIAAGTRTASSSAALLFSDLNGVSFGLNAVNGTVLTASVAAQSAQTQNVVVPSAGTQTASSGTVVFSNSNGITFGMSGSSRITASHDGLTSQSNQALSGSNGSFTFQTATFGSSNGLHFYTTNGSLVGSYTVPVQSAQPGLQSLSAGTTRVTTGEVVFADSNGISFGVNGGTVTASHTVDGGNVIMAGTRTATTVGIVNFSNSNGVSFGLNAVNGSILTASVAAQTAQTQNVVVPSAGTQTATSGTVVFADSNGISFGMSGSSQITASYTVPSVPAQTNQTIGWYAVGNTTGQSSSSTIDARTVSLHGAGIASVGYSAGSAIISVPSPAAQTVQPGLQSLSAGTTRVTTGEVVFSNSNGISFGVNGATVTASYTVPTQTNQTLGLYAVSNTTGQSSSSTFDARTLSFHGAGIASVGYSGGSVVISVPAGAPSPVNFSAGTTSGNLGSVVFSNSNGVSFGLNGATVTASVGAAGGGATNHMWRPDVTPKQSTTVSNGTIHIQPFQVWNNLSVDRAVLPLVLTVSTAANSSHAGALSIYLGIYSMNASTLSLITDSSGSQSYQWTNTSNNSTSLLSNIRIATIPVTINATPGEYYLANIIVTTSSGNNWFTCIPVMAEFNIAANTFSGHLLQSHGLGTVQQNMVVCMFSATSTNLPSSMAMSNMFVQSAQRQAPYFWFNNGTIN